MIKKIGIAITIVVAAVLALNILNQIKEALKSSERLDLKAEAIYKLEQHNKQLKQRLQQIQSESFLEEQARNKLGLAKVGETIVIIPEEKIKEVLGATESAQIRLPNWLGWWRLFFK